MRPVFAHIRMPGYINHGDRASVPQQYFAEYKDCPVIGLDDIAALPKEQPVILGGGGILAFPEFIAKTARERPTIIWGAGLNNQLPFDPPPVVEALTMCALVGIRDRKFAGKFGFDYVPCASCMHPEFRFRKHAMRDILRYQHAWREAIPGSGDVISNMDPSISHYDAIAEISNSWTVITNSFHGAYWAQLAGRRVILWRTGDLRFFSGLPLAPTVVWTEEQLQLALDYLPFPNDNAIYAECVNRNLVFQQDVKMLLEKS